MKPIIFVDGQEGTTGLQIHERLAARRDIEVLKIEADKRKDLLERKRLLNAADIVFLCLPDDAARESVSMVDNPKTRIIDASTAYRTDSTWVYGMPELSAAQRESIRVASRVSNPGCHATGFIAAVYPLVHAGIIAKDAGVSCTSITGYSGAGKKTIAEYEQEPSAENEAYLQLLRGSRPYALGLAHKHIPEMKKHAGLDFAPLFSPIIGNYAQGLIVEVPLFPRLLPKKSGPHDIQAALAAHYKGSRFVTVHAFEEKPTVDGGFLNPQALNGTNRLDIFVFGHDDQVLVCARLDNLGKGASGAAVQNMNLMIGADEAAGLA